MKVSILMCAYNAAQYIDKAIQSVIGQTYTNWELIISNDASTDNTRQIVEKYLSDTRIKLFNQPRNLGYLDNKNWLFQHADGDLLTQLDADDTCANNRLEKQVAVFANNPSIMICAPNHKMIDPHGNIIAAPLKYKGDFLIEQIQLEYPFWYSSLMFKKELIAEFGLFSSYFAGIAGDDQHWTFKVNQRYPIYFIKDVLYDYRIHSESYTNVLDNLRKLITPEILCELFRQRLTTGTDYLEIGQEEKMRKFEEQLINDKVLMAEKYRLWAAKAIDKKDWDQAKILLKKSLALNKWNATTSRTIFYYFKQQSLWQKISLVKAMFYFMRSTALLMPFMLMDNVLMAVLPDVISTCDLTSLPEYLIAA